jgi:hypothetical protein
MVSQTIVIDQYVIDVLMRDLVSHDRTPSAFLVYLHLWGETERSGKPGVKASHQTVADCTGLSKSAVQKGIRPQTAARAQRLRHRDSRISRAETVAQVDYCSVTVRPVFAASRAAERISVTMTLFSSDESPEGLIRPRVTATR